MMKLTKHHTMFGHQHATEYGHGRPGDANRSHVKSVGGSHPPVVGVNFRGFPGSSEGAITRAKEALKTFITKGGTWTKPRDIPHQKAHINL